MKMKFFNKIEKTLTIPSVDTFRNIFASKLFGGRTSKFSDYYKDWVNKAIKIKAQECASTPVNIYKENRDGELEVVLKNPLKDLLTRPNPEMTFNDLIESVSSFLDIDGNAYILKVSTGGKVQELWPLRSDWITIKPSTNEKELIECYFYKKGDKKVRIELDEIIHIREFNPKFYNEKNPYKGIGTIEAALTTIQEDETIKEWNSNSLKGGAVPPGVLEYDGQMSEEQRKRIEAKWNDKQSGASNAGKVPFLQGGLRFKTVGLSQKELDFIGQRKMDRDDILAMFGVPKGLLFPDEANYASAKASLWSFARFTIKPILNRIELSLTNQLAKEFGDFVIKFDNPVPEDKEAKINTYDKGCNRWLTVNDIRRAEGLDELEGGDEILSLQQKEIELELETEKEKRLDLKKKFAIKQTGILDDERTQRGEKAWNKMLDLQRPFEEKYLSALKKYFVEAHNRITKKLKTKKQNLPEWVSRENEVEALIDILDPLQREMFETVANAELVKLIGENFDSEKSQLDALSKYDLNLAEDITDTTIKDIKRILKNNLDEDNAVITDKISKYFTNAERWRAERIARTETIRTANHATVEAWKQSGVVDGKEWYTAKDERVCPYCKEMDGKTTKLNKSFVKKGGKVLDMELDYRTISEPPLHAHCRCTVLSVIK